MKPVITEDQIDQYNKNGYVILRDVIPQELIKKIQDECEKFIAEKDAEMDAKGVEVDGITLKGKRYFIAMKSKGSKPLQELLYGKELQEITKKILGDNVYLFQDQFVIKAADKGLKFDWHQDSGYLPFPHKPYFSAWLPLDDVNEENGTVYLLTYDEAGTRTKVEHKKVDEKTNDEVGYFGDNPGTPAILKKGDVALFSSTCFHRSGSNNTNNARRALLMQYSPEPLLKDGTPYRMAESLFINGKLQK